MTKEEYNNLIERYQLLNKHTSPLSIESMIELLDIVLTTIGQRENNKELWDDKIKMRIKRQRILNQLAEWEKTNN